MRDVSKLVAAIFGFLALLVGVVFLCAFLVTLVWSWVVPDVFAGAVQQGVLPAELTLVQAIKLTFLFSILGLTNTAASRVRR